MKKWYLRLGLIPNIYRFIKKNNAWNIIKMFVGIILTFGIGLMMIYKVMENDYIFCAGMMAWFIYSVSFDMSLNKLYKQQAKEKIELDKKEGNKND